MAAMVTASNLGARITGYGFVIFLFGSLAWLSVGMMTHQHALLWTNAALTILNIWGIWRWLGRQAKLEKGGEAALDASRDSPGEALFPASILSRSAVNAADGIEVGRSVDAMIGSDSGEIHYLVVSAGGLAGVGERLHRVKWRSARFAEDVVNLSISSRQFTGLPAMTKDDWPGG